METATMLKLCPVILWSLPLLLLLSACAGPPTTGVLFGPSQPVTAADYDTILKTWTRSTRIYDGLDTKAFITATFHAPEFRRVFALAFPDIYGHGGDVTRRELVDLTEDVEQYLNFFVALYTPDRKWNDLAKNDSIWRLSLTGNHDVSVAPVEVVPVKIDENLRAVYPHLGRFDKVYIVRFPLADPMGRLVLHPSSEGFSLRLASALGHSLLNWKLQPPSGDAAFMKRFPLKVSSTGPISEYP
jgi:hypothetical protein